MSLGLDREPHTVDQVTTKNFNLRAYIKQALYRDLWESKDGYTLLHTIVPSEPNGYLISCVSNKIYLSEAFRYIESTIDYYTHRSAPKLKTESSTPFITCFTSGDETINPIRFPYTNPLRWKSLAKFNPTSVRIESEVGHFSLHRSANNGCILEVATHQSDIGALSILVNRITKGGISIGEAFSKIGKARDELFLYENMNRSPILRNKKLQ